MNEPTQWAVTPRSSEALVPCASAGSLVVNPSHRVPEAPGLAAGSDVHSTQEAKRADAVASGGTVYSGPPAPTEDLRAIEAWENEGDPN
jgi:hypothetical protein